MDDDVNEELLILARSLESINSEIIKIRKNEGKETYDLRRQYFDTKYKIIKLLSESPPLDNIRDEFVRRTLKRVRDGNYYPLDIESKNLDEKLKTLPLDIIEKIMNDKGIFVSENEIDNLINEKDKNFFQDVMELSESIDYFKRKEDFSTIITDSKINNKILSYFDDIRFCYLFGRFNAVIGLCRVIIELSFKDKFVRKGLGKRNLKSNIHDIEKYKIGEIIYSVCNSLGLNQIKKDAFELYSISSKVLHGNINNNLKPKDTLEIVRKTYLIIEKLYGSG